MSRAYGRALRTSSSAAALSGPPEHATTIGARPRATPSRSQAVRARASRSRSAAAGDAFDFPADFALFDRFALVMQLFSTAEAELHLCEPALEIDAQRDERQALLLKRAGQALDLARVEQQLSVARRLVLGKEGATLVGRDAHVDQPRLTIAEPDKTVAQSTTVRPQALHLGAGEHETRFEPVD